MKTNKRKRVTDSKKHKSEDGLTEGKNYFHILIDPWLRGSQSDVAQFFSQQWHANESAVQTIEELEKRIWEIEELASPPVNPRSPTASSESENRYRGAQSTQCWKSHEFTDHMHKETLLEVPSSVPVFAASQSSQCNPLLEHLRNSPSSWVKHGDRGGGTAGRPQSASSKSIHHIHVMIGVPVRPTTP